MIHGLYIAIMILLILFGLPIIQSLIIDYNSRVTERKKKIIKTISNICSDLDFAHQRLNDLQIQISDLNEVNRKELNKLRKRRSKNESRNNSNGNR